MANALAQTPIIIDTAFSSYKAAVATILGTLFTLRVYSVRWVAPGVAGHQVIFNDPAGGAQLYQMVADTAGKDVWADWSAAPRLWRDFGVSLIQSGKLFIDARP